MNLTRRFASVLAVLLLVAASAQTARAGGWLGTPESTEPFGTFHGLEYVRYTGWFEGATSQGAYRVPYQITHSLLFAMLVSLATYLLFPPAWLVVALAYFSHILIDIPTHEGDFATRIFYPITDFHFKRKNWATHPGLFFAFWGGLIFFVFLLK